MLADRNLRERLLGKWGHWSALHFGKTLLIGGLITLVMTIGVSRLELEMTFFSIMPGSSSQVQDLKRIMNEFPFASGIVVVVDGRDIEDPSEAEIRVKDGVDKITSRLKESDFEKYISDVSGEMDMDFFKQHGLVLTESDDIERFTKLYENLNLVPFFTALNNDFEEEYSGQDENLQEDEELAVAQFKGLGEFLTLLSEVSDGKNIPEAEVDRILENFIFGDGYFMSRDNKMALIIVQPTFTMEELGMLVPGVNLIEEEVKNIGRELGLNVGCTGITTVGRDEMVTSEQGLALSMTIAMILIMLLMIFAFRMFSVPLISGIPLVIGIYWTLGITGFVIHRLNIITAMYMVALIGLGIDFAIHLLTTYRQERDRGEYFADAVELSFVKSGAGIITGALTTAIAFFALQFAKSEIMKELGLVAGFGLVFELLAMLIFIPAFLGLREHREIRKNKKESGIFNSIKIRSNFAGGLGTFIEKRPVFLIISLTILIIGLGTQVPKLSIETNLMNMEAEGLESVELQDVLEDEFQMGADGMFILTDSLDEVKYLDKELKNLDSIKQIDSIGPMLLTVDEYQDRIEYVENFRELMERQQQPEFPESDLLAEELIRLQMNLLEMSDMAFMGNMDKMLYTLNSVTGFNDDGEKVEITPLDRLIENLETDPESAEQLAVIQSFIIPKLREKLGGMSRTDFVEESMLPDIYRKSYISQENGDYLVSVIPTRNPWEGEFREIFTTQLSSVTEKGTGMILVSDQLTEIAEKDGVRAGIVAVIAIFLVLLLDFKNFKLVILTMVPLLCAFISLFGFMGLTGIKFDFVNIIAVPLLTGMGVDYAVHISHRYLIEGKGSIKKTVEYTGTAVLLTTLTTIIAFASFIPSVMRAMSSTGVVLSVAIAFAFFYSIILYPALLKVIIDDSPLNIKPWFHRRSK